jgi:hypothetical protein
MGHKVYICFKTEDAAYKTAIQNIDGLDYIDKSLNVAINSTDEDYIMQKIRSDYLSDSSVTIFLIGSYSNEDLGETEQSYIKRELQGSLYNSDINPKNGILGIVLPSMTGTIYKGSQICATCGGSHNIVAINDSTAVREFSYNYYIPNGKCAWSEDDRYCVLVTWENFCKNPEGYIDEAFEKRSAAIANKTRFKPTSAGS